VLRTDARRGSLECAGMSRWPLPPAVVLAGLVCLSAALRFVAAHGVPTPWIAPDEFLYALLGRDLYATGRLTVLGGHQAFYSLVYPALVGLPLSLHDLRLGYTLLKAVQAVVMSLAAVPVYLWARTMMRARWALAAAALTLAIPGLGYSGLVMTEVVFYPVAVLAAWAAALVLADHALWRQSLFAAAAGIAILTRLQLLVLLPIFATAVALKAVLDRDVRSVARLWPLGLAGLVVSVGLLAAGTSSVGGYASAANTGYDAGGAARFVLYQAAAVLLLCGVAPACAVALLVARSLRRPDASPSVHAYLAVAVSSTVWLTVEVGVFASQHADKIVERNLLPLAPILFVGFALWLDRGGPRTYVSAAGVALAAAAVVLLLPFDRFVTEVNAPDSLTFDAALHVLAAHPSLDPLVLLGAPAVVLAALVALLPRRALPVLVALLLALFAAASVAAGRHLRWESTERQALLLGPDPRWIDAAADGPVGFVFAGGPFFNTVWEHVFWNRRIRHVYDSPGATVLGPMPQQHVQWSRRDGVIRVDGRPIPDRYIVLPGSLTAVGTQVATTELTDADQPMLGLWRLDGVPRIGEVTVGRLPNGDVYTTASITAYACTGGSFVVTLLGKTSEDVDLLLDGRLVDRVHLEESQARTETIPVPARAAGRTDACTLELRPSTTLGTTVLRFDR
jgi:hypothetical protein